MDFKKDWAKLAKAALLVIGAVFYVLALVDKDGFMGMDYGIGLTAFFISGIIFFLGSAAYIVCKLFDLSFAKFIILGVGAVNTILAFLFLFLESIKDGTENGLDLLFGENASAFFSALFVGSIIVFALIPLVKGIAKLVCNCEKEAAAPVAEAK